LRKDA
jgi:hypothetical protein